MLPIHNALQARTKEKELSDHSASQDSCLEHLRLFAGLFGQELDSPHHATRHKTTRTTTTTRTTPTTRMTDQEEAQTPPLKVLHSRYA